MSENIVQDLRAAEVAPSIDTGQDKQEIDQPTTTDDLVLQKPPYKPEYVEMKELAIPDSTPIADNYSLYSARQKKVILVAGSFAAFFSPVSSNIYFPAISTIAKDLHVSLSQINLTITTYQVSVILCPPDNPCYQHLMCQLPADYHSRLCRVLRQCSLRVSPTKPVDAQRTVSVSSFTLRLTWDLRFQTHLLR